MRRTLKKVLALTLSLILVMSCFAVSASAANARYERATTVPTVYVQGYGSALYSDSNNGDSEPIYGEGVEMITDGVISSLVSQIIEPLMSAIATGDYTEYNDIIVNTLVDDLGRLALDENGEATNGTGNACRYDIWVQNRNWYSGKHDLFAYTFQYDWRVDPFYSAQRLNEYIKKVKAATGYDKVNLVGRCLGANIVLAYLSEYGNDDINALQFYVAGMDGFEFMGALFSGNIVIDTDVLNRWFYQMEIETDDADTDELINFAKALVSVLNTVNGLNLPVDVLYSIYDQIYTDIIPRILKGSFGTMPAFWSMVGADYFDDALALNFPTDEDKATYAGLIEKITKYHENVSLKTEEIIQGAIDDGVPVYFIAKYGYANMPLSKEAGLHSDGTVSVTTQSMGATSTEMGTKFTKDYLNTASENGLSKYISPDKCIDASTAFVPDSTWFIKNSSHALMPDAIDVMMANIFDATGYGAGKKTVTVDDLEAYPQYLRLEENEINGKMVPLTEDNATDGDDDWNPSFFEQLSFFLEKILNFINEFVTHILELIKNTEI